MQHANILHNQIAKALTGLIKQIKAIRYYPPRHPALKAAAEETQRGFVPILSDGNYLFLTVHKEGFIFDDTPVAKGSEVLTQLATFCFARRIKYLSFMSDLNSSDLHHFVQYLLLDPQILQKQGGIQKILEKARLTTIWTNVRDLDEILGRREEIEALPEDENFDPSAVLTDESEIDKNQVQAEALTLQTLLTRMEQEKDDSNFDHSLQELIPLLRLQLVDESRAVVLRAFLLLCRCATGKEFSEERKGSATLALGQLSTDETTNYLIDYLFDEGTEKKVRTVLGQILSFLGERVSGRIMQMLANEESASKRKGLNEIIVRSGAAVLPSVNKYLEDERWFVVRNSITILGDIRSQESLAVLSPLLQHDEIRVRRETIRALTKIGGKRAINILQKTAVADDQEMRRQAVLSLGALRATAAVPTLLALLKQKGWSQREIDLRKDTIRALGEIHAPEATPELVKILKKKRWMNRQLNDELRAAAADALGDLADESTQKALEKATNDRNASVARAAAQALKQLDKANT